MQIPLATYEYALWSAGGGGGGTAVAGGGGEG